MSKSKTKFVAKKHVLHCANIACGDKINAAYRVPVLITRGCLRVTVHLCFTCYDKHTTPTKRA